MDKTLPWDQRFPSAQTPVIDMFHQQRRIDQLNGLYAAISVARDSSGSTLWVSHSTVLQGLRYVIFLHFSVTVLCMSGLKVKPLLSCGDSKIVFASDLSKGRFHPEKEQTRWEKSTNRTEGAGITLCFCKASQETPVEAAVKPRFFSFS